MKKIITLLLLAVFCAGMASAQIVRSQSRSVTVINEPKKDDPGVDFGQNWLVKVGGGFMVDDYYTDLHGKYSVIFGYQRQFYKNGLYWGAQAGLNLFCYDAYYDTSSYSYTEIKSGPALSLGPTIGLKRPLGTNTTFDTHIGVQYARLFASDDDGDDCNRVVWEFGLGIWYKRFLIELEYQGSYGYVVDNGLLLNLGFKF